MFPQLSSIYFGLLSSQSASSPSWLGSNERVFVTVVQTPYLLYGRSRNPLLSSQVSTVTNRNKAVLCSTSMWTIRFYIGSHRNTANLQNVSLLVWPSPMGQTHCQDLQMTGRAKPNGRWVVLSSLPLITGLCTVVQRLLLKTCGDLCAHSWLGLFSPTRLFVYFSKPISILESRKC